ncbi:MAG: hypothetical protein IIA63_02695 [Nitrospinae bacterium]|nr:hypothetical protein [Nitrospinota bacterium]
MRYLILLLAVVMLEGCAANLTEQQWQEELKSTDAIELCKNQHNAFRKALNGDRSKYSLEEIQRRGIDCDKEFEVVATKGRWGIDLEEIRISALTFCGAAGFKLGTESHSHCMMSEMRRQIDAINFNAAQRRAILSQALHNMSHSYYQRAYPSNTFTCREVMGIGHTVRCAPGY